MKKGIIKFLSIVLSLVTVISVNIIGFSAIAANYTPNYWQYDTPEDSGDYAYWSGSRVVRSSSTNVNEVKWMQAALNYCIVYKGLSASKLDVDGSFGKASKATTTAFQKKYNLSADGKFGPATINKMKSVLSGKTSTSPTSNTSLSVSSIKTQITSTYKSAKKLANAESFSGNCGLYVKSQLHVLGIINRSEDTDCTGHGNRFYYNVKTGKTSTGYTKTKVNGGANCLANLVKNYGNNLTNIVISYPHQYGRTNRNPGYGHVVFIHAIIDGTVYYSDNYTVGGVSEGGVLTKTVAKFDSAFTSSYGNAIGAIYFHK